jgi:predicted ester cyclase
MSKGFLSWVRSNDKFLMNLYEQQASLLVDSTTDLVKIAETTSTDPDKARKYLDDIRKREEDGDALVRKLFHTNIEHIVAENDLVVVFCKGTGTHKAVFQGKPPTNKRVNIRSTDLYRIENEKIVQHWDVVDQLNLLQQIGASFAQVRNRQHQ